MTEVRIFKDNEITKFKLENGTIYFEGELPYYINGKYFDDAEFFEKINDNCQEFSIDKVVRDETVEYQICITKNSDLRKIDIPQAEQQVENKKKFEAAVQELLVQLIPLS